MLWLISVHNVLSISDLTCMLFLYEETGYIGESMDILLKQLTGRTTVAHAVSYNNFDMCDHAN